MSPRLPSVMAGQKMGMSFRAAQVQTELSSFISSPKRWIILLGVHGCPLAFCSPNILSRIGKIHSSKRQ